MPTRLSKLPGCAILSSRRTGRKEWIWVPQVRARSLGANLGSLKLLPALLLLLILFTSCAQRTPPEPAAQPDPYQPVPYVKLTHPDWSKNASIYQINTRAFTPEGTFRAAEAQLPRLKDLGVEILWLMPINPIGAEEPQGHARQPLRRTGLPQGQSRIRHPRRLQALRRHRPSARLQSHPRLGRQPHRLGQRPRHPASRLVRTQLEGRIPSHALVRLVRHHRPRLLPPRAAQVHDRRPQVLGPRGRHRRLPLRRRRLRPYRLLEQRPHASSTPSSPSSCSPSGNRATSTSTPST